MVKACCAWGCTHRYKKRNGYNSEGRIDDCTFFSFPLKNKELCKKWITAIRREDFTPSAYTYICSCHFLPEHYNDDGLRRRLKKDAVPSVFSFPEHLQKKATPRRKLKRAGPSSCGISKRRKISEPSPAVIQHDHSYVIQESQLQRKANRRSLLKEKRLKVLTKRVKQYKQQLRRLNARQSKLKTLLKEVKDKHLIESSAYDLLEEAFGGMSLALFRHLLQRNKVNKHCVVYSPEVKKFAVTLNYLSSSAYEYVRTTLGLPHPGTLRKWQSSIDCNPGFLDQSLDCAGRLAKESGEQLCSLIFDEMSLRTEVGWSDSQHCFTGHVDFGGGPVENTVASHAMMLLAVSLSGRWKAPIGYFLTDHINSTQLGHIIADALQATGDRGLIVKAIVGDGLKANMKAAAILGFDLNATNPKCHINHPHSSMQEEKVWYVCDPPHMLKLTRNLLADRNIIYKKCDDGTCQSISWKYIKELHNLQSQDSLYLANKLSNKHIDFRNVKMKVSVAAQTLSSSVATALDHLRDDLHLPAFQGSRPTCEFIRYIDELFDRLNAKNPFAKGHKAALSRDNQDKWQEFFKKVKTYLLSLLDRDGKPLYASQRGQAIVGFIVTATSAEGLAKDVIESGRLKYLLPYKFSQDHLEMLFSKIRRRGGWNNNPTAEQFRHALRILLQQNEIKAPASGNTIQLDDTEEISVARTPKPMTSFTTETEFVIEAENLERAMHFADNEWQTSCLVYTAGFICRRLLKKIKCIDCQAALKSDMAEDDRRLCFLKRKNNGGLLTPSSAVVEVIKCTEQAFRTICPNPGTMGHLPYQKNLDLQIQMVVAGRLQSKLYSIFPSSADHFCSHEFGVEEPHALQLIKMVSQAYISLRLWKCGKQHHQRVILQGRSSKRMKLNKLILFSGL